MTPRDDRSRLPPMRVERGERLGVARPRRRTPGGIERGHGVGLLPGDDELAFRLGEPRASVGADAGSARDRSPRGRPAAGSRRSRWRRRAPRAPRRAVPARSAPRPAPPRAGRVRPGVRSRSANGSPATSARAAITAEAAPIGRAERAPPRRRRPARRAPPRAAASSASSAAASSAASACAAASSSSTPSMSAEVARRAVEPVGRRPRARSAAGSARASRRSASSSAAVASASAASARADAACAVPSADGREPRAEPLDRRRGVRAPGGQPRRVLPERGQVGPDTPFGAATSGERGIRLVRSRAARTRRGRRCASSTCRRSAAEWAIGVVEPLLQEERLAQPPPGGLERVAHVACGRRAELRLGERHLAFGLAHGRVGLHDEALGPDLERRGRRRGATRSRRAPRRRNPTTPPAIATAAAPKTRREGNHQRPSAMCRSLGRAGASWLGAASERARGPDPTRRGRESAGFVGMRHPRVLLSAHASAAETRRSTARRMPRGGRCGAPRCCARSSRPWLDFSSLEDGGLPTTWPEGVHRVRALAFRRFPAGDELVDVSYPGGLPDGRAHAARRRRRAHRPARGVRSVGPPHGGLARCPTGARSTATSCSPTPGAIDLMAWYPTWAFWQWRGMRLRQLAPGWAYDPPGTADADAADAVRAERRPWGRSHDRLDRRTAARRLAPPRVRALRGRAPAQRARPCWPGTSSGSPRATSSSRGIRSRRCCPTTGRSSPA